MGALISMTYAQADRARLSTLTVAGPAGLLRQRIPLHRLLRSDLAAGFVARRFGRRLLQNHLGHNVRDPQRAAELAAMVLDAYRYEGSMYAFFDTLQHLSISDRTGLYQDTGALGLPTLLIWGADDQVTPIGSIDVARALLKPQQCHVIPACGHMAPFECPREVADMIASFAGLSPQRKSS
jgi:pimeloyl-ACP methyl ester carboxylesterase